ncbi:TatD family hydrolase [Treponema sp.]|uniref:TatD family hydrolase n=1 Tax=Treponema sp. TaxID=166 RepID=UPI003F02B519
MFSDTHFHFQNLVESNSEEYGTSILEQMADNRIYFGMDIGTRCFDLMDRAETLENCMNALPDVNMKSKLKKSLFLSAGIWPDPDSIRERESCMETLRESIEEFQESSSAFSGHLAAIGEGGIDHHWNPEGPDGRCESDFDAKLLSGEKELFEMQLDLAKELDLPFIVHSRDGFKDTIEVMRAANYNRGIIHCFSYGLNEAKAFLDMGWYLAFGGATTYTKKAKMDELVELLRYVPKDRILLETDAPYLAPVPMRGSENTPLFIKYTYEFIAEKIGMSIDKLNKTVDENCMELFRLKK